MNEEQIVAEFRRADHDVVFQGEPPNVECHATYFGKGPFPTDPIIGRGKSRQEAAADALRTAILNRSELFADLIFPTTA